MLSFRLVARVLVACRLAACRLAVRCLAACPLAALLGLAGPPGPVSALAADAEEPACVRSAVAAIQARYESAEDLSARFEQTTRSVALGGPGATSSARGQVVFAKPGKMRWTYQEPEPSLVVSDGETLWIYDPALREAQKYPVGDGFLSAAAIQFLLGEGEIERDFRVEAGTCDEREAVLTLHPKKPASYEKLRVTADPRTGDLRETQVVDLLGNVTRVAFQDLEIDVGPDASIFRFEPPDGVEVVEMTPPEESR